MSNLLAADASAKTLSTQNTAGGATTPCPLQKRWALEACVVGDDDRPVHGIGVELSKSSREVLRTKTDTKGIARFEGIESGAYKLSLYELDKDAWQPIGDAPLAADAAQVSVQAQWGASPASAEAAREHTIDQGDSIASIAELYGYFPDTIWDAPDNEALRKQREDKNVLMPGDVVKVPAKRMTHTDVKTGIRYRLRRKGVPEVLKIRFLDTAKKPRPNVPYHCEIDNARGQAIALRQGKTNGDGVLLEGVPLDATVAKITLNPGAKEELFQFKLGHVDPIDTPSGVQARLKSLRYSSGEPTGHWDAPTREALKRFQADAKIPVTGEADAATIQKLREAYIP